jgi:1-deoxyxylulose-5-phosphate synthase
MKYRNLGQTGLKVSEICLGCMSFGKGTSDGYHNWTLDEEESRPLIQKALESGINFFDTANGYSMGESEEVLGRALLDFGKRDDVIVATKAFFPMRNTPNGGGLSRKSLFVEVDASLKRLGTDYIDLYYIHRWDFETPIEETLEALHDIVRAGKARYLGASSMRAYQFAKALHLADRHGWTRFRAMQPHYNLLNREEEREMIPLCIEEGVGIVPWSPLARGILARPWSTEKNTERSQSDHVAKALYAKTEEADKRIVDAVQSIANARGISMGQIAAAWMRTKPGIVAPIIGATKMKHLEDGIASLDVDLTQEEITTLEAQYIAHEVVGLWR